MNSGSSAYRINGLSNPALTLERGGTYVFSVNASGHPFWIKTVASTGTGNAYNSGVTGNGAAVGTVTFKVPTNAPNTLFYICQFHSAMTGTLRITNPPAPPTVRIVQVSVGARVVVKSTGATNWNVLPEYVCSLTNTNWTVVPAFTNVLANNTNTTTFDRLDAVCGSANVFLRIRNQKQ